MSFKPSYVTDEELVAIRDAAKKRVRVACDEYHQHAWECLVGPEDALLTLRLCETIADDRGPIKSAAIRFKTGGRP